MKRHPSISLALSLFLTAAGQCADGHTLRVREARLSAGAGFLMLNCGDIMTMPGLLKALPAMGMDLDEDGRIVELS